METCTAEGLQEDGGRKKAETNIVLKKMFVEFMLLKIVFCVVWFFVVEYIFVEINVC